MLGVIPGINIPLMLIIFRDFIHGCGWWGEVWSTEQPESFRKKTLLLSAIFASWLILYSNRWVKWQNPPQIREPSTCRATWTSMSKNWPLVEVEAFSEEQELFIPFEEEVPGSGHLWLAGILADAGKVDLLFLHVVA